MKYTTKKRNNMLNDPCISPFVNDCNVTDIPVSEYHESTERAIKHAYELGLRHTIQDVRVMVGNLNKDWE